MTTKCYRPYVVCIAASLLAGALGSYFTGNAITTWYAHLTQPYWTPPNWVFGPVWTTLYILMGIAAGLVWKSERTEGKAFALSVFFFHLLVNASWSIVFFGLQDVASALIIIKSLWLLIVALMLLFWRFSHRATYLLIPYLLWVSYASTLNLGILILNQ